VGHWSWSVAVDPLVLLTILAIIGGAFWEVAKIVRRIDRRFSRFQEDWEGTPGRPGVPPKAGVMERLSVIEVTQTDTNTRINDLSEQVKGRRR
jgi:hypothetical protein